LGRCPDDIGVGFSSMYASANSIFAQGRQ